MEKLRKYLNSLSVPEQKAFATRCLTTVGYLRNALSTGKRFDGALCVLLEKHSDGYVKKQFLRPDIWPELVEKGG